MDKKRDRPSIRVVVKYFILQLPGQLSFVLIMLLFRQWVELPGHLTWGLIAFWVGKDVILFPFLWRFYDPSYYPDLFHMVGRKGVALTRLDPDGRVRVRGERWRAVAAQGQAPIDKGQTIRVEAIKGLRLKVSACSDDGPR